MTSKSTLEELVDTNLSFEETDKKLSLPTQAPPLPFENWEALAYDIVLGTGDLKTLSERYGLFANEMDKILDNSYFKTLLQAKKEEVDKLGSNASFVVKMRLITNKASSSFLQRLLSPSTSDKDFSILYKTAVELAQLTDKSGGYSPVNTLSPSVPQVVFNIQGVPDLVHLERARAEARADLAPIDINADTSSADDKQEELIEL